MVKAKETKKTVETKKVDPKKDDKKTGKNTEIKETKKTVVAKKPEPKKDDKKPEVKEKVTPETKTYHVSQRQSDGMWQVKFATGEKAIKLFKTQAEAISFAKEKAVNQDGNIAIHKVNGKLRKQKY